MSGPRIVILGAGAAGLCMAILLKRAGFDQLMIVEKSGRVGGTWHDNRYPGAGCDVPSHLYCFSFVPNPDWSRRYALQPEIEQYFSHCVERFRLAPHLRFHTEVSAARFDETQGVWHLHTRAGETLWADVLISGLGQLNRPYIPPLPGLATFAGACVHSARWPSDLDLRNKDVVVLGSGASAVQLVPELAPQVRRLTVLQRSANYVLPRRDRPYQPWEQWVLRNVPGALCLVRSFVYASLELRFPALRYRSAGALLRHVALHEMHRHISDPTLRAKLTPDYPAGCKRVLISDNWYPALLRHHVAMVTSPLRAITADAVVTRDGAAHPADVLVLATGFETTRFLAPLEITGRGGKTLDTAWAAGAEAYLGMTVAGFPNLFLLYGPNTNLGHNSILFMLECQARYIVQCMTALKRRRWRWMEVRPDVMARFNAALQRRLRRTVWATGCHSWYKNGAGKITNNWPGSTLEYWWRTRHVDLRAFACGR